MVSERREFGERLKRQRERSGVSLESIAQLTKVPASLFAGLERGDCSRWPAGIYGRAYVKAYAEAVGLHVRDTVDEYSAIYGGPIPLGAAQPQSVKNPLRLGMAEESTIRGDVVAKRAALAAADLVLGSLIASVALAGLGATAWVAVASVLAYFVVGRLISEEPLLYWIYLQLRAPISVAPESAPEEEVPVGDAASTAA